MRKKLIYDLNIANNTVSPVTRNQLYTCILVHPKVEQYLSRTERASIFYNRSIAKSEIAETYFQNMDYKQASNYMLSAKSDAHWAELLYTEREDINACKERIIEYHNNRNKCLDVISLAHNIPASKQLEYQELMPSSIINQTPQLTNSQEQEDPVQYSGTQRPRNLHSNIEHIHTKRKRISIFANLNLSNLEQIQQNANDPGFTFS